MWINDEGGDRNIELLSFFYDNTKLQLRLEQKNWHEAPIIKTRLISLWAR